MKKIINFSYYVFFWTWNLTLFSFVSYGLIEFMKNDHDILDLSFYYDRILVAIIAIAFITPLISMFLGAFYLRKKPLALRNILFGLEAPVAIISILFVALIRQPSEGVIHIIITIACFYFGWLLYTLRINGHRTRNSIEHLFYIITSSLFIWLALWVMVLFAPFIPVLLYGLSEIIKEIFNSGYRDYISFWEILFFILAATTLCLISLFPIIYLKVGFQHWTHCYQTLDKPGIKKIGILLTIAIIVGNSIIYVAINQQSHQHHLSLAQSLVETKPVNDAAISTRQLDSLKNGLLATYLSPYRYMGEYGKLNNIQGIYEDLFKFQAEKTEWIQQVFNLAAKPVIYHGSENGMSNDQETAENLYAWLFDEPIQKAESAAINQAINATLSRDQNASGLIDIDSKKVLLETQEISITENQYTADIEIREEYSNTTRDLQEVNYHFQLPQHAVITGLWLGNNGKKEFAYRVAARGAAQRTYNSIVSQRQDPALLEQVGPGLYRLRIYPIPRKASDDKMNVWLRYRTLPSNNAWPFPSLTEKRNVYWDSSTQRSISIDGRVLSSVEKNSQAWLPPTINPINSPDDIANQLSTIDIKKHEAMTDNQPLLNIAVFIDASASMRENDKAMRNIIESLSNTSNFKLSLFSVQADYRNTDDQPLHTNAHPLASITNFNANHYMGNLPAEHLFEEINQVMTTNEFDRVILLSDSSLFREQTNPIHYSEPQQPTDILLVDKQLPISMSDAILTTMLSPNNTLHRSIDSLTDTIKRTSTYAITPMLSTSDYAIFNPVEKSLPASTEELAPLLSYFSILSKVVPELSNDLLREISELAIAQGIVTPYNSMIVLVSDAQQKQLDEAEKLDNAFSTDAETGVQVLDSPGNVLQVTGVPEPEEWLLIIMTSLLLLWHLWRRKLGHSM